MIPESRTLVQRIRLRWFAALFFGMIFSIALMANFFMTLIIAAIFTPFGYFEYRRYRRVIDAIVPSHGDELM